MSRAALQDSCASGIFWLHFSLSCPVWCTGGPGGRTGLTKGKKRLFLKLKLLSCLPPRRFISSLAKAPGPALARLPALSELQPAAQRDPELGEPCQHFGSLGIGAAAAAAGRVCLANSRQAP